MKLRKNQMRDEVTCVECGYVATHRHSVNTIDPKTGRDRWVYTCEHHQPARS